jgi:two-component system NarL family response regulator
MNVLIADDHPLFRRGLIAFFDDFADYEIVAECGTGRELLELVGSLNIDIIFLDINLPDHYGLELLEMIRQDHTEIKVVILTMHDEAAYARRAFDLGADGYLVKDDAEELLWDCLQALSQNKTFCSIGDLYEDVNSLPPELSTAERRIFDLVALGNSSYEIAALLDLSVRTIDNHRANIARKLGLRGSNALLKFAIQHNTKGNNG